MLEVDDSWTGVMVQWVKALATQAWQPELKSAEPI